MINESTPAAGEAELLGETEAPETSGLIEGNNVVEGVSETLFVPVREAGAVSETVAEVETVGVTEAVAELELLAFLLTEVVSDAEGVIVMVMVEVAVAIGLVLMLFDGVTEPVPVSETVPVSEPVPVSEAVAVTVGDMERLPAAEVLIVGDTDVVPEAESLTVGETEGEDDGVAPKLSDAEAEPVLDGVTEGLPVGLGLGEGDRVSVLVVETVGDSEALAAATLIVGVWEGLKLSVGLGDLLAGAALVEAAGVTEAVPDEHAVPFQLKPAAQLHDDWPVSVPVV